MKVEKDYEDLLKLFNKHKVRYCIVGAYAVAFHGFPRYTKDLDIFVEPSLENGQRIVKALKEFGFGKLKLRTEDFAKKGSIIQLGYEPLRIDLVTAIDGVSFGTLEKKKAGRYGKTQVFFIGKTDLIMNKKASGRKQDWADIDMLLKTKGKME